MQIKLMGGITSIRIIKLCGKVVGIPLNLIFRSMFEEGVFPYDWKKKECSPNPPKRLKT